MGQGKEKEEDKPWTPEYKKKHTPSSKSKSTSPSPGFLEKYFPSYFGKKKEVEKIPVETPGTAEYEEERRKRMRGGLLKKVDDIKEGYGIFKKLAEEGKK